jgi:hypothetical protein
MIPLKQADNAFIALVVVSTDPQLGARVAIDFAPRSEGQIVNDDTFFASQPFELSWDSADRNDHAIFLGFRLKNGESSHFGWIRLGIDDQSRVTLRDLAYESVPEQGIRIAYVPETIFPTQPLGVLGALLMAGTRSYRRARKAA